MRDAVVTAPAHRLRPGALRRLDRLLDRAGLADLDRKGSFAAAAKRTATGEPDRAEALVARAAWLVEGGYGQDALSILGQAAESGQIAPDAAGLGAIRTAALAATADPDGSGLAPALARISRLAERPDWRSPASLLLLDLAETRAVYGDDLMALCRRLADDEEAAPAVRFAAWSHRVTAEGATGTVAEQAVRLAARPERLDGRGAALVAAVLEASGADAELAALARACHGRLAGTEEHPALSAAFLEIGLKDAAARRARRIVEARRRLEHDDALLWGLLAEPARRIAVVGNAPSETGRGRGADIDGHDLVVRFNRFRTDPPFDRDYGTRTSVQVRPQGRDPSYRAAGPLDGIVLSGLQNRLRSRSWLLIAELQAAGERVGFFPADVQTRLVARLGRAPSAGLTMTAALVERRGGTGGLGTFGFSFTDQIGPQAGPAHYFDRKAPVARYDWPGEAALFTALTGRTPTAGRETVPARPGAATATASGRTRYRILGDHSGYHAGCDAVMEALRIAVSRAGEIVADEEFDVLLMNGEGSMHHDTIAYRNKMRKLAWSIARDRPTYLINSVWQANSNRYDHVLHGLAGVVVREEASRAELLARHGIESIVRLDLAYSAPIDETAPFRDYGGRIVWTDHYDVTARGFRVGLDPRLEADTFVDMAKVGWSSLVRGFRTASILVTGRHHAFFAACRARLPFVVLRSNTHKIEGVTRMSGLPIPVADTPGDVPGLIDRALTERALYDDFFDWMETQPRFSVDDLPKP